MCSYLLPFVLNLMPVFINVAERRSLTQAEECLLESKFSVPHKGNCFSCLTECIAGIVTWKCVLMLTS